MSDYVEDLSPVPHVTCVTWSQHNFFYVGTDAGTVKTLMVQEKTPTETDVAKYELVWGSDNKSFIPERYVTCATNLIYTPAIVRISQ